jgi:hypothetical protein
MKRSVIAAVLFWAWPTVHGCGGQAVQAGNQQADLHVDSGSGGFSETGSTDGNIVDVADDADAGVEAGGCVPIVSSTTPPQQIGCYVAVENCWVEVACGSDPFPHGW